jgi:hypothetical protein
MQQINVDAMNVCEKREERENWVKVEYNGGGTRKEQVDWAWSGFGG